MTCRRMCSSKRDFVLSSLVALALVARDACAQDVAHEWLGDHSKQGLGMSVRLVGDVNADGFVDVGLAGPGDNTNGTGAGMLRVVSGADGSVLWTWYGDQAFAQLGNLGDALGDLNGDGYDDVLTNEPRYSTGLLPEGRVFVFSGKDGSTLLQIDGTSSLNLGGNLCGLGDIDGDSVPDFAVGDLGSTVVNLFSGATGNLIRTLTPPTGNGDSFGAQLADIGDLDGDLVPDLLVTEAGCFAGAEEACDAFSGKTGTLIWRNMIGIHNCGGGGSAYMAFGYVMRVIGDVNGDGIPDLCTGGYTSTYGSGQNVGAARCHSGKDGSFLFEISEPTWLYRCRNCTSTFGAALAPMTDANGDGVPDIAVADVYSIDGSRGIVFVFSGVDGTLLFHVGGDANSNYFGTAIDGGVDVDGDGRQDLFAGDWADATNGWLAGAAWQFRIEELTLDSTPRYIGPFGAVSHLAVNGGPPGNLAGLFVVDVNGTSQFALLQLATFDSARRWSQVLTIAPALAGTTVTLRAYALDANGKAIASNDETITFQ